MNYDRAAATALRQINDKGRTVTLLNKQLGAYNPLNNTMTNGADTTRTVKAVFTDYSAREIDGEVIRRGDKKCLVAGAVSQDEILVDGPDQYKIVNVQSVQPGDTLILSKVQVRR